MGKKIISYIIPCYRSEKTIESVAAEVKEAALKLEGFDYELILVNDCSPDDTLNVIKRISDSDDHVTVVDFARNFGQHAALMAGLRQSKGDICICLDDDGQTPPSESIKLVKAIEDGADAAYARYGKKKHSLFRNFGSMMNEEMARFMLGKPKDLFVSSYFAVNRMVVNEMIRYENSYPYVIGLVLRTTKSIVNVDVEHKKREIGESGYTFSKLINLWMNGFTAFSIKPLRVATCLGGISAALGFIYGIIVVIQKFVLPDRMLGYSSLMAVLIFFGGMIMIMLGLIGEYVGRLYICMNAYPQYVIKEIYGNSEES
ncbi:MAG: glycosyltransferase family 2 protein [Lachnospiraceae bacterium]|nr:glycosyltransferase family 2 protein [Lachnospiraceae bacterium]